MGNGESSKSKMMVMSGDDTMLMFRPFRAM